MLGSQLSKVIPVCNGMNPREDNDRISHQFVERYIFFELNYAIKWCLSQEGDQRPTDGKDEDSDIEVEDQGGCTGYRVGNSESSSCVVQVVLHMIVEEAESEDHGMHNGEGQ